MFDDDCPKLSQFRAAKPTIYHKAHRLKFELGHVVVMFHVNVSGWVLSAVKKIDRRLFARWWAWLLPAIVGEHSTAARLASVTTCRHNP